MGMRSVAGWFLGAGIVLRSKRFPRCWKWGAGLLLGGLAVTGFGWGVCVHAADAQGGIAITGRGNGPVRIVDPDGSVQEISPDRLKFPNQPGSRLSEGHRGEGAGASGSAGGALKMREERVRKEREGLAEARRAAEAAATAEAEKRAAEKKKKREEKIIRNYVDKEWRYGPNSAPEEPESSSGPALLKGRSK
ncbi:MAG TPA: hypothetical protein PLO62_10495 [Candidatus Hydrogenedentes bacterium]|nr:hypothetical protein [Candidatus Hydrogenedentota bacterium]